MPKPDTGQVPTTGGELPIVLRLKGPKEVRPAKVLNAVTLERLVDFPGKWIVRAFVRELEYPVVLWSGDAYRAIGDWTQAQANERLVEILSRKA